MVFINGCGSQMARRIDSMTEPNETKAELPSTGETGALRRKRKSTRARNELSRGFSRLLDAELELVSGVVEAAGSGIRAFKEELPERRAAPSADWTRSFVSAFAEGSVTFLQDLSQAVRRTSNILLEEGEGSGEEDE
jgi:hypothetical protein